jgi:hypothetical protein
MLFFAPNSIKVRVMEKQHDFLTKLNGVGDPLLKFAIGKLPLYRRGFQNFQILQHEGKRNPASR